MLSLAREYESPEACDKLSVRPWILHTALAVGSNRRGIPVVRRDQEIRTGLYSLNMENVYV